MSITKRVKFSKTHEDQWLSIKFLADKAIYHDKNIFACSKSFCPLHHLRFLRPACLVGENEGRRHKSYFQFPHQGQGDLSTTSPSSIINIMEERHHMHNSWIFYQLFIAIKPKRYCYLVRSFVYNKNNNKRSESVPSCIQLLKSPKKLWSHELTSPWRKFVFDPPHSFSLILKLWSHLYLYLFPLSFNLI